MRFFGFQWHITDRCNLRCSHCYQEIFSNKRELSLDELKQFVDKIFGTPIAQKIVVNITGGEPFFYPQIAELLSYINGFDTCSEINIITNGTFINERLILSIKSLNKIRYIKVSIESPDEITNDRIRGKDSLKIVTDNLEKFKMAGKEIIIMMTLASYNFRDIEKMIDYAVIHNLSGVIFERFIPLGNGNKMRESYLKKDEWKSVIADILRIIKSDLDPDDLIEYKAFMLLKKRRGFELKGALCNLGRESMALMPDGSIYPCRRYNKKIADIKNDSIKRILQILSGYDLKKIKKRLRGDTCGLCGLKDCIGCRALVYALTGDEYGDDPQCFL